MPEWTKEQLNAIESRDGTILVSAAAGSGKTAVLVERVVQRLMDEKKPCNADRLLIVTFTRAATQQMKDRIFQAISDKLKENPSNNQLRRQLVLLPFAHISTIDSFCNDIVRENFHEVDVAPDYKMLSDAELKIMQSDALDAVMNEMYKENSAEFSALAGLMSNGADDTALSDLICNLYNNSMAFARPEVWLDSLCNAYTNGKDTPLKDSAWGKIICSQASDAVNYCTDVCERAKTYLTFDEITAEKYSPNIREIVEALKNLSEKLKNSDWDEIRSAFLNLKFSSLKPLPRGYSSPYADIIKAQKSDITDILTKKIAPLFCASQKENRIDTEYLEPIVKKLISCVKRYGELFSENKKKANGVDFSDITHLALSLLVNFDECGNAVKKELAKSMSEKFDEILVDEYQDINEIQNVLFSAVSKENGNLFTVGDVKQSIYRFRQAMPEIFIGRRDKLEEYTNGNYPAKITLGKNFRSRSGVTENINFIFSQLMSKKMGGINYDADEELIAAADYNECDFPQTEMHIVGNMKDGSKVSRQVEAQHVADTISEIMESKMQIKDKGAYRDVMYRDFCILLRAANNGKAEIYADALSQNNIPAFVSSSAGFFASTEVSTVLNIIRITDNPIQDIPLLAVMLSPVYGFTPNELAKLRIPDRKAPLYHCLVTSALGGDKKSKDFIEKIEKLRMLSSTLPCSQFIRELYEATGYSAICAALKDGSKRQANLNMLLDYAVTYEDSGKRGLSGFIRFIDRIQKENGDLESASDVSQAADVVRIMTIHKSKGLEFPICIVADLTSKFNNDNKRGAVAFHPTGGICFDITDNKRKVRYASVGKKALMLEENRSMLSEELRILYVALTRAKERLICVAGYDNIDSKLSSLASKLSSALKIPEYVVANCGNMAEWILLAFLRHPDACAISEYLGALTPEIIGAKAALKFKVISEVGTPEKIMQENKQCESDAELLAEIDRRLEYQYPYAALSGVQAKSAPSEFDSTGFNTDYFAATKPQFLSKSGMNPASRGTATHKFMEFYDYTSENREIKEQIDRMIKENRLTADEAAALEIPKLEAFFKCETAERIRKSPLIMREKKVTVGIPAGELYPELPDNVKNEMVVVQGYVDCAFEENGGLIIVDYKTDRGVDMEQLRQRYSFQLKMYERALHECTGKEILGTLIYSFENDKTVSL